jgi:DNA-binding transcriptional regulator YiaG
MGEYGETGDKGAFLQAVSWEDHFQALRGAVKESFKGKPGYPVAVYLLDLVRDMAGVFSMLMDSEPHRAYYLREVVPTWLRATQPCPWDWETMRPILQKEPFSRYEGPRPTHHEEAAAWLALSNGMAWMVKMEPRENGQDGAPRFVETERHAILLHGLQGLTAFPEKLPPPASWEKWNPKETPWRGPNNLLAAELGRALELGGDQMVMEASARYGFILPQPVRLGGGFPVLSPTSGAPSGEDLLSLLGSGSGTWPDLTFKGETRGRTWEVSFSVLCRGLELVDYAGVLEAHWGFDVSILWSRESLVEAMETKAAAMEWDKGDWLNWTLTISSAAEEAISHLKGGVAKLQAHAVATTSASAATLDAVATPKGMEGVVSVGEARGVVSGGKTWDVVLPEGPTRMDRTAKGVIQGLFGMGIPKDIIKAPRWEDLVAREVDRLIREATETGQAPYKNPALKFERDQEGNDRMVLSAIGRRSLREKSGARGFIEARKDRDGSSSECIVKRFRQGSVLVEVAFSWYSLASGLTPQSREQEKKDLETKLKAAQAAGSPLPFDELDPGDQEAILRGLERLRHTDNASVLGEVIQREFGRTGAYPVVIPDLTLRHALQLEKDPNGHAKVAAALNALQKLHFSITVTGDREFSGEAFGPFIGGVAYDQKLNAWSIDLSMAAIGSLQVFKMPTLHRDGLREAFTFDFMRELEKEDVGSLDYDQSPTSLAPFFHTSHNFTMTQKGLFGFLENNLTKTQHPARRGREAVRITKRTHPEYGQPRVYRRDFCPLIPVGLEMVGFLGFKKDSRYAESGWKLWGTSGRPSGGSGAKAPSILQAMGVDLPPGAAGNKRNAITRKALEDLEAVVVKAMGGLVATLRPNGQWQTLDQAKLLPAEETGKKTAFFIFAPTDWLERMQRHHVEVSEARGVSVQITTNTAVAQEGFQEPMDSPTLATEPLHLRMASTRKERKLTQAQVAEVFNVSRPLVAQWEKGSKEIPERLAAAILAWVETGDTPPAM